MQTEKLEFLIQSLIKMSRLETDVLEVIPKVQNIAPLLSETVREMSAKAKKKEIIISGMSCGMVLVTSGATPSRYGVKNRKYLLSSQIPILSFYLAIRPMLYSCRVCR